MHICSTVIAKVNDSLASECARHKQLPPLVQLMNRPRIVDKNLIALGDMSSTYRDNFNKVPDPHFSQTEQFEYHKPVEDIGKQLDPAAKILYAGTTKVGDSLNGVFGALWYAVYLIYSMVCTCFSTLIVKHMKSIFQSHNHPVILFLQVTLHVPGYRGHIPENMRNVRKFEHAIGAQPHPIVNNLRLTSRNMGCVLGYTGKCCLYLYVAF
ncbi:hypothetical protein EON63_07365 [archaeon]|nr:MAG: hypothetical protein EON63_07365 [archaeon]